MWIIITMLIVLIISQIFVTCNFAYYDKQISIKLRLLWFCVFKYPAKPKKLKTKKINTIKPEEKEEKKPKKKSKKKADSKHTLTIKDLLANKTEILALLKQTFHIMLSIPIFKKIKLYIKISGEDSYTTSIRFGQLSAVINYVLATMEDIIRIRKREIKISPVFSGENVFDIKSEIKIKITIGRIFLTAFKLLIIFLKVYLLYRRICHSTANDYKKMVKGANEYAKQS